MKIWHTVKLLLATLLCTVLVAGSVQANHYVYFGEDGGSQIDLQYWEGVENSVFYWWAVPGSSMWWYTHPNLSAASTAAFNSWGNATGMPFHQVADTTDYDLWITEETGLAAYSILSLTMAYQDSARNANYNFRAVASIRNTGAPPVGGWESEIAYNIGRFVGLHKRFRDDGGDGPFCSDEITIMNHGDCANRPAGPANLDVQRVNAGMYQGGDMLNVYAEKQADAYRLLWQDGTWGEYEHRIYFYWYDMNAGAWVLIDTINRVADTGMRETWYHTKTLHHDFFVANYAKGPGYYDACVRSHHRFGGPGAWRCGGVWRFD